MLLASVATSKAEANISNTRFLLTSNDTNGYKNVAFCCCNVVNIVILLAYMC